jgi:hypothetical protein
MAIVNLPVDDGSILTLVGVATDERPDDGEHAPILGPVSDFLQQFLVDGALVGVIGNASYDLLKALRHQLQERGILPSAPVPGIDDVRAHVTDALTHAGHPHPTYSDVTQHADKGWELHGTTGTATFTARADPHGQVIHLRVG